MKTQLISILKKGVIFVQKDIPESCNFCVCFFAFINQTTFSC